MPRGYISPWLHPTLEHLLDFSCCVCARSVLEEKHLSLETGTDCVRTLCTSLSTAASVAFEAQLLGTQSVWHPQNRRPGRPGRPGACPQRAKPDPQPQSGQWAARPRSRPHFHSRSRSPGTGPGPSPPAAPCGPALPPPGAGRGARRGAAPALALLLLLVLRRRCPGSCPLRWRSVSSQKPRSCGII